MSTNFVSPLWNSQFSCLEKKTRQYKDGGRLHLIQERLLDMPPYLLYYHHYGSDLQQLDQALV
jgi:hypothetical protein